MRLTGYTSKYIIIIMINLKIDARLLQPSKLCPPQKQVLGFMVPAHRFINITLLALVQVIPCGSRGESPTYILNEDTYPVTRAIGVSHTV